MVVAQGKKRAYLKSQDYVYSPGHFLLLTAPLPIECQVIEASVEIPYMACSVPLDLKVLISLVCDLDLETAGPSKVQSSITRTLGTPELRQATARLLECLLCVEQTKALGEARLRELYFFLLKSPQGNLLRGFLAQNNSTRLLTEIVREIHADLTKKFSVSELAEKAGLSVSSFHRAFKSFTSESPGQYIKSVRLHSAYSLMHYDGLSVAQAAERVGYESASQFGREFKRTFGLTPGELLKKAR